MLGVRSSQLGLLEADHLYLDHVGRHSFYGFLASMRGQLFRDEEFAELYCPDNGRDSVPPSLVATALLLQAFDKVSDAEAKQRADFDIRWKVALGIEVVRLRVCEFFAKVPIFSLSIALKWVSIKPSQGIYSQALRRMPRAHCNCSGHT